MSSSNNNHLRAQPLTRLRAWFHPYSTGRVGLFFISVAIKLIGSCVSGLGIYLYNPALALTGILIWLAWFAAISGVAIPGSDSFIQLKLRILKPIAVIITIFILIVGLLWGMTVTTLNSEYAKYNILADYSQTVAKMLEEIFYYKDTTALCQQAGDNYLKGVNPYAGANIVTASITYNVPGIQVTPLRRGVFANDFPYPNLNTLDSFWQEALQHPESVPPEIESKFSYPAGSFLILVPFLMAGIQDIRIVFALFVVISLVTVAWLMRGEKRLIFILAVLVSLEIFSLVAMGDTGILQLPFLLLGWVLWKRQWQTSAILMGLAIAIKQISWVYLLFYLILIYREVGTRRLLGTIGISGGVFLAANLPFFIMDPGLWISSMAAIVTDPMFPMGVGFVSIVMSGLVVIKSSLIFNLAMIAALIAGLVWYYCYCRRYPYIGPILAIVPFFFAWRSMWGYLFFADLIVFACVLFYDYSSRMVPVRQPGN